MNRHEREHNITRERGERARLNSGPIADPLRARMLVVKLAAKLGVARRLDAVRRSILRLAAHPQPPARLP